MQKAISTQKTDEHVTSKYLNKVVKVVSAVNNLDISMATRQNLTYCFD